MPYSFFLLGPDPSSPQLGSLACVASWLVPHSLFLLGPDPSSPQLGSFAAAFIVPFRSGSVLATGSGFVSEAAKIGCQLLKTVFFMMLTAYFVSTYFVSILHSHWLIAFVDVSETVSQPILIQYGFAF